MAGLFYIFKRARAAQASIRPPSVVDIREGGRSAETSLECLPGAGSPPSLPNRLCGPGQDSYNGEGGSACGQRYQGCISLRHPALAIARDRNGLGESAAGEADRIDE